MCATFSPPARGSVRVREPLANIADPVEASKQRSRSRSADQECRNDVAGLGHRSGRFLLPLEAARRGSPAIEAPDVEVANAGDHAAVHRFLLEVFQGPSREAFYASLDDPFYEPSDRLVVKNGHQVVAHLHMTRRVWRFGRCSFPASGLCGVGTSPEFRGRGYASQLLATAQHLLDEDQTALSILRTSAPEFFRPWGWIVCGRHSHARASTRDLLAQLRLSRHMQRERALCVRPWRQVELAGLLRLHQSCIARCYGCYERTEAYWRWLVSRRLFDQILVAVEGGNASDDEDCRGTIVGFAVTREDRVLEAMAHPDRPGVALRLLARACREAIERDYHTIYLHAPAGDRLLNYFDRAGGQRLESERYQGQVYMVRLRDPMGFLRGLLPELRLRADRAGLARPCELGFAIDGRKYQMALTRRGVKISRDRLGRSYLEMRGPDFIRMLLGHLDLATAIDDGRVQASTRVAQSMAQSLFPPLPLWRPPLDDLAG